MITLSDSRISRRNSAEFWSASRNVPKFAASIRTSPGPVAGSRSTTRRKLPNGYATHLHLISSFSGIQPSCRTDPNWTFGWPGRSPTAKPPKVPSFTVGYSACQRDLIPAESQRLLGCEWCAPNARSGSVSYSLPPALWHEIWASRWAVLVNFSTLGASYDANSAQAADLP